MDPTPNPNPSPALSYFLKANLANPILVKGKAVPFEHIGNNWGVIALDQNKPEDRDAIEFMNGLTARGVGGVSKLSAEQYAQKKSQPASTPLGRPREWLRQRPSGPQKRRDLTRPVAIPPAAGAPAAKKLESPTLAAGAEAPLDIANLKATSDATPLVDTFRPPTRRISRTKPAASVPAAA